MSIQSKIISSSLAVAEALPVAAPATLAAFGAVAIFLLLCGQLENLYVWPLGLTAAIAAAVYVSRNFRTVRPGTLKEQRLCDLLIVAAMLLWVTFNFLYTSQNVFVFRDPGTYTVAGAWLIDHSDLTIKTPTVFSDVSDVFADSAGFGMDVNQPGQLFVQGLHLLPVFLGLIGRLTSDAFMLHANVFFGGMALLAVYGFARYIARPRWALLVTLAFAVCLPLLYFSRDAFTEPLAIVFTFGALSLLYIAQQSAKQSHGLWFLAGLTAGAGTLTRADGYLTVAVLAGFAVIYMALSREVERLKRARQIVFLGGGAAVTSLLGWLDVTSLSNGYYITIEPQMRQQLMGIAAIVILGAAAVWLAWHTKLLKYLDGFSKQWRAFAAGGLILAAALVLASRPFWYVGHDSLHVPLVGGLQAASGNPVEDTRNYVEQSVNWILWYLGPCLAVLGLGGLMLAAARSMISSNLLLIPSVFVLFGTALVFLTRTGIAPDQIWASRRLLPVIMPGLAVFGALALEWLWQHRGKVANVRWGPSLAVAASVLLFAGPLFVSYPFLRIRTYHPQLAQVHTLCEVLPKNAAVLWVGTKSFNMIQSVRTFCGVPAMRLAEPHPPQLAKAARSAEKEQKLPVIAIDKDDLKPISLPKAEQLKEVSSAIFTVIPSKLYNPPRQAVTTSRTILMGVLQRDGSVQPLENAK
ncbi:hypothetical protein TM7_0126 [candidate division TM7 genomosp. GTL1]|nr:hypothetical protein TM7_0126 [candidate division TM7 genomosp. GTL1]